MISRENLIYLIQEACTPDETDRLTVKLVENLEEIILESIMTF